MSVKHSSDNGSDKENHPLLEMLRVVRFNNSLSKISKQLYTLNLDPYSLIIDLSFWNKEFNQLEVSFVFGLF